MATSNSARSPMPSTCSAACPASARRSTGTPGASTIPSRPRPSDRAGDPGPGAGLGGGGSRRRSRRDGGSSNPRASSWSGARTATRWLPRPAGPDRASVPRTSRPTPAPGGLGLRAAGSARRAGETVTQSRFIVDREVYQGPSPTLNATPILTMQRYLADPEPGLGLPHPGRAGAMGRLLRRRRSAARGRRRLLWWATAATACSPTTSARSRSTRSAGAGDRTRPGQDVTPSASTGDRRRCWCSPRRSSTDSVRQALRDLRRPDLLARNPLLRTRLVRDRPGHEEPDAATLEAVVTAAIETLRRAPAGRQAVACRRADLSASGRHPGTGRRGARTAVQHLPPPPHPGRGPGRGLAVGPGGLRRAALSTTEQLLVW